MNQPSLFEYQPNDYEGDAASVVAILNHKPTQKELVLAYVAEYGHILPAKMGGVVWSGHMFGSETTKRCRELRAEGKLWSEPQGKFEVFFAGDKR